MERNVLEEGTVRTIEETMAEMLDACELRQSKTNLLLLRDGNLRKMMFEGAHTYYMLSVRD